ncbi:MAG: chemotaxis protein CheW [Candidatus Thiodiazotropha sp. (ex Monitilora ramsayi)]|nr:chemotaxis protein CheW [Candidatus Thiodiazotropha sp. (ex Monitilora ramsayi)]
MTERLKQQRTKTVAKPDVALADYLDTLLSEIDGDPAKPVTSTSTKAETAQADILLKSEKDPQISCETVVPDAVDEALSHPEVPEWAEVPFQVLTFSVNNVNLAVPLSRLNGILPIEDRISQLPGQPDWSLGVVLNQDNKVVVVDTQRLLMPEKQLDETDESLLRHILLIGEGSRGLAVESLKGTEMLDKTAIRWRGFKGTHPWYAGIIIEKLTVMIDVDGVMEMLAG